jgi:A118 family predicted phage portal protein
MFLKEKDNFPPKGWEFWFLKYNEWSSWYSGDPQQLLDFYTKVAAGMDSTKDRFWTRLETEERSGIVHFPLAGDICGTSADLLFSESPIFKYDEKAIGGQRIKDVITKNGFNSILLEGAEMSAALSGCILKLDIEPQLEGVPIINVINPLQFIPTFWRGRLWEVLFFRTIKETDSKVYRLFENRRMKGNSLIIEHKLNEGTRNKVGKEVDLDYLSETQNLKIQPFIEYKNMNGLGCVYVPNKRPNKLDIGNTLGINDFSGEISLLDSLDFAWTSWMRDIELGMGQIFVDEELLHTAKTDVNGTDVFLNKFSKFQKSFIKLNLTNWKMGGDTGAKPIDAVQLDIRVDEHMKTCTELAQQIASLCGYSPQTFGFGDFGNAQSGTALKIRENKSQKTRSKKEKYFRPAILKLMEQAQNFDKSSGLYSNYENVDMNIEIEDSIMTDNKEVSETIKNLYQAKAISNYMKVKLQHPDWDDSKIQEEVDKINSDEGITEEIFNTKV